MKSLFNSRSQRISLTFSYKSFTLLDFTFWSTIHSCLTFVSGVMCRSKFMFSFLHMYIQLFRCHLLKKTILSLPCLCTFVEKQLSTYVCVYFWTFYFVLLMYLSIFTPILHCLDCYSFIINSKIRLVEVFQLYFSF